MRVEIKQSNRKLEQMFDANVDYYHQLVKYILAGEQGAGNWKPILHSVRLVLRQPGTIPYSWNCRAE